MYPDPWDLKHQIQQLQQEQQRNSHNTKLISSKNHSSNTFTDTSSSKHEIKNVDHYLQDDSTQVNHHQDQNSMDLDKVEKKGRKAEVSPTQQRLPRKDTKQRKQYGNLIVFCKIKNLLISLGPNYMFFGFAYSCFTLATYYLIVLVNSSIESSTFQLINLAVCLTQNLSYLAVAISDPGIQLPEQSSELKELVGQDTRYCRKCWALQQRKTYHCRECDVCVNDYDHHCPWTSKCIGGNNLKRFYLFVGVTPFYIFYYVVVFMICMANIAVVHNNNSKAQPPSPVL